MQGVRRGLRYLKNSNSEALPEEIRLHVEARRRRRSLAARQHDQFVAARSYGDVAHRDPQLTEYSGNVADSGEGRWTVEAAVAEGVPAEVITSALFTRFRSRVDHTFAAKILSAMRQEFGGHIGLKSGN